MSSTTPRSILRPSEASLASRTASLEVASSPPPTGATLPGTSSYGNSDLPPSSVFTQHNPLFSRGKSASRDPSLRFDNEEAVVQHDEEQDQDDVDADFVGGEKGPPSNPQHLSFPPLSSPRATLKSGTSKGDDDISLEAATRTSSSLSASSDSSLPFLPHEIRIATLYLVFLLVLQSFVSLAWIGSFVFPPLPDNYYNYTNTDALVMSNLGKNSMDVNLKEEYTSICTKLSDEYSDAPRPLHQQPLFYTQLNSIFNPFVILIAAFVLASNPRGKSLHFEYVSASLTLIHLVGTASIPSQTVVGRLACVLGVLVFLYFFREGLRRRQVFASYPDLSLARVVLVEIPTAALAVAVPVFFLASDGVSCLLDNFDESRLCEDKIWSNQTVSLFIVVVTLLRMYDFKLGTNAISISSFLRFDFDPFRAQVFVAVAIFECVAALYIYASGNVISCYDDYIGTKRGQLLRSQAYRVLILNSFQVIWTTLVVLLMEGKFLVRTAEWEKRLRKMLLTEKRTEFSPFTTSGLVVGMLFLFPNAIDFLRLTMSLRSAEYAPEAYKKAVVKEMNVAYRIAKFSSPMISLFGAIIFLSSPKRRHRMRFFWGMVVPFTNSLLVLVAVLINPTSSANGSEAIGHFNEQRTLVDWNAELVFFSVPMFVAPIFFIPSQHVSRTFLGLQLDADIELHLQRSAAFFLTKIPPMIYLLGEASGCLSTSYSVDTCMMLLNCNYAVVLYLVLSSALYLYFNHAQNHYEAKNFLDFQGVDVFTVVAFLWEGIACVVAYCCFGLRPKNRASVTLINDVTALSEYTGTENEDWTVVKIMVSVYVAFILFGYSIVFVMGYFSLRHREVLTRSQLSGGDNDEILSSRTARGCISLEKRTENIFKLMRVPEDEITISVVYKVALVCITWVTPVMVVAGSYLWAMRYIDARLWLIGVSIMKIGALANITVIVASSVYLFADLKREPSVRVWRYVVSIPILAFAVSGFLFLLSGEVKTAAACAITSFLAGLIIYYLKGKHELMVSWTTPAWRKQKLLQIFTAAYGIMPTFVFLSNESLSCAARASFNTPMLRARPVDPGATYENSVVEKECRYLTTSSAPILIACGCLIMIQGMTIRKSDVTTARLMTLQLPLVDIIESGVLFILLVVAIGMFCFRNSKTMNYDIVLGFELSWCLLFVASAAISYVRDRLKAKETTMQLTESEEEKEEQGGKARRPPMKSTSLGVSTRTLARRSIIALGRLDGRQQSTRTASEDRKSGVSAEEEGGPSFDINPGLM